jgi:glycosyltransferase involved in cell wall biosynthesis
MRLLILDENYPHLNNLMGDVFVHVRAKEYARDHELKVFSFFHKPGMLEYEGIAIEFFDDIPQLAHAIKKFNPDKILIHFYQSWMLERIIKICEKPVIVWVHGYEALGWYRRLFNYTLYSPVLFNYIRRNIYQQYHFRKLIQFANKTGKVDFVFVSNWMRKITEFDSLSKIKEKYIIANPIDTNLFAYSKKKEEQRKHILVLRSFNSNKYANDISIKAILLLSQKSFFSDLHFTVIGTGYLFKKLTAPLRKFKNVDIQERAVRQILIPEIHALNGIFLCPTRQDAQGVSMCEAMSSGLVPITSSNTAIPEFVQDQRTGILTKSIQEVADAIEMLYFQPELFMAISSRAATFIREKCSLDAIVSQELAIIEK